MMEKFLIILLSFSSLIFADHACYDLDAYQDENGLINNWKEVTKRVEKQVEQDYYPDCISDGGEGSTFEVLNIGRTQDECLGMKGSKHGYIKFLIKCNLCTGKNAANLLKEIEEDCKEDCRVSNAYCKGPSIDGHTDDSWGGKIFYIDNKQCGEKLPECQDEESSDSQGDESSSSAFSSSSLPESSDSNEESSSSEDGDCDEDDPDACSSASEESSSSESLCPCTDEDGPCFDDDGICSENMSSSSSKKASSSSMNGRYDLVYDYEGLCNGKGQFSNAFCSIDCGTGAHYMRKPGFVGSKKLYFWCSDNGDMEIRTNIPEIYPNVYLHIECYNSEAKEWRNLNVPELPLTYLCYDTKLSTIEGCPTTESVWSTYPYHEWAANLYAELDNAYYASSVSDLMSDYYWVGNSSGDDEFPSNYSRMDLLNEPEFVSFFNECKRRVKTRLDIYSMAKEEFGDFVWHGENTFNLYSPYVFLARQGSFDFSDEYYQSRGISSYEDYCQFLRGENAELYQSDSLIYEVYYDEESSHISKTYDIIYYCAPPKSSSSSAEVSSSSESSSSSEFSSSSEKSSSSEESSSSEPPSSSSLSSSREESSSSSEEIVVESSSVMPVDEPFVAGPDQVYTPDQIFSSGLQNMEPGACYSLNPDRGTQHGWINNNAQDSWWWREVDCTTGEKVDRNRVGQCPGFPLDRVPSNPTSTCFAYNGKCYRCKTENSYVDCSQEWLWKWSFNGDLVGTWYTEVNCNRPLMRRELDDVNYGILVNESFDVNFTSSQKYFDIQGRNNAKRSSSERVLYRH
ncbi:MAG: hypothetical protein J6W54_00615 [Fibrobacter sp.]|uniref:hypothetical protein n=1 Tax=Fibrobacter sp. TaxID=35828 RepID=UPI001B22F0BA|nr:hypothetical protein [Fibrobacter sp.]MBO7059591.1 hypothetical protein [Fibrobacter sp.]